MNTENNVNDEGHTAMHIHMFVFFSISSHKVSICRIGLGSSGSLHSQKHLIAQVHFRCAYRGILSAVFPSDAEFCFNLKFNSTSSAAILKGTINELGWWELDNPVRRRMLKPETDFVFSEALRAELRNITYGAGMYVVTSAEPQQ